MFSFTSFWLILCSCLCHFLISSPLEATLSSRTWRCHCGVPAPVALDYWHRSSTLLHPCQPPANSGPPHCKRKREDIAGRFFTFCGVFLLLVSPNPSCPCSSYPQVNTFPSSSRNAVKLLYPPATATIPERLFFCGELI